MGAARERVGRVWQCSPRRGRATQGEPAPAAAGCMSKNFTIKPPKKQFSTRISLPEQASVIAAALGWQFRVTRGMLLHEGMQFSFFLKKNIYFLRLPGLCTVFLQSVLALPASPCSRTVSAVGLGRLMPAPRGWMRGAYTNTRSCLRETQGKGTAVPRQHHLKAANSPKVSFSFAFGTSLLSSSAWWAQPHAVPAAHGAWLRPKQAAGFIPGGAKIAWHSLMHLQPLCAPSAELLLPRWKGVLDPQPPLSKGTSGPRPRRWKETSDTISLTPRGPGRLPNPTAPGQGARFPWPQPGQKTFPSRAERPARLANSLSTSFQAARVCLKELNAGLRG